MLLLTILLYQYCFKSSVLCVLMHACMPFVCRISSSSPEEKYLLPLSAESVATDTAEVVGIKPSGVKQNSSNLIRPWDVLALAKKAVMVSKEAASLAGNSFSFSAADLDEWFVSYVSSLLLPFSVGANYMMLD